MEDIKIRRLSDLDMNHKVRALDIFVDGFRNVLSFTKDDEILKELFMDSLDFTLSYVAICDDNVIGFMAIGNNKKRPVKFDIEKCKKLFGDVKGKIIKKQLSSIMEKIAVEGDKDLYIDYLTTDKKHRGKGIGSKLIEYACESLGYETCYIEVLSKNIPAKKLYENIGFKVYKRHYNLITIFEGLGYLIKLKKEIGTR